LGVQQPGVSKMLRGNFRQFSVESLLRFLVTPAAAAEFESAAARLNTPLKISERCLAPLPGYVSNHVRGTGARF
jgi:hypothetical protein